MPHPPHTDTPPDGTPLTCGTTRCGQNPTPGRAVAMVRYTPAMQTGLHRLDLTTAGPPQPWPVCFACLTRMRTLETETQFRGIEDVQPLPAPPLPEQAAPTPDLPITHLAVGRTPTEKAAPDQ